MTITPPTATYRLQLQPDFPFAAAADAVPYVAALGVSHLHLSPVLESVPGSTHGYDVVDHTRVRAELGGEEGLRALARTAHAHGLGLVLDIVPNHMAVPAPEKLNTALWSVLRDGPSSPCARWFDIDWAAHGGKMLLPVLGERLGESLAAGVLRLEKSESGAATGREPVVRYHDHLFPVRPGTEHLALPELLHAQHYRLAWWRLARTELNYRRFFTISELIGVRVEDPDVFDATHGTVLRLLRDGVVDGLRIDHPDGLADPHAYLHRLREASGGRWTVVEKILCGEERLPRSWECAGTTGYDALTRIDGLFVDPVGAARLAVVYRDFASPAADRGGEWAPTARAAAHRVIRHDLAAEVERLVRTADRICAADRGLADHAPWALRTAIRELLVRLPVYRPYTSTPAERETAAEILGEAADDARYAFAVPEEAHAVDVVTDLALGRLGPGIDHHDFAIRFAQLASALHAKSVEDTAFYRYVPLLSSAEVGGDPGRPGTSPGSFHAFCERLQRDWPDTGTVLSTHDTKRSAEVRSRMAVLTELPDEWATLLEELSRQAAQSATAPDRHVEYVAWQTAVGFASPHPERLSAAVMKSVREAALRTGWTEPDEEYEQLVGGFVAAGVCGPAQETLAAFGRRIDAHARANSLGAALVHLTMPGVPDLYQGTEGAYEALVDPDNRRPVCFRPRLLAELDAGCPPRGRLDEEKRLVTAAALRLRRERPQWFGARSSYAPLPAQGPAREHLLAFCRAGEVITAVTRLSRRLEDAGGWRDTVLPLPGGRWRELLTGEVVDGNVPATALFTRHPVALLRRA
ncbi:malto-oligosyltrehalose synthase [Streptomyces sp. RB6PN25]|uniref:Malto-oligosyltrehalose synthase n=1 Tax=Streptomyces humicola TaxID=2953240 RepID=A0ABT1PZJ3_9ACTN|nr:malto-oligosyltrehalose synthase [Streptomyces humicola]MCQ4083088.1 malto-oligosyltrehalose synthase [Streptomyces humicola]